MEKPKDEKNTLRRINLQRNAVKGNMLASTTGTSATRPSERQWSKSFAPNKWLSRWTSLRTRTTVTKPAGKKSSSTLATGGSTLIWHALIQYRQGTNPSLKVRCQQCNAWSEQKTKRSKKHWHKPLHPRLLGTGIQAGGSLILSTHFKNGMTADNTGELVFWWLNIFLREESQRAEEFGILSWKSVTADGSLLSPTGCVKGISCTSSSRTFTIHKWLRQTSYILTHNMNKLEHIANNGTDTTKHTDVYNAQFWSRRAPSVDAQCSHIAFCGSRSRLVCHSMSSMHAHLCLVSWVVSPHPPLYFLIQFLFQLYLMSNSAPDEISIEDHLCNSSLGSMVTLDYVTLLTQTVFFLPIDPRDKEHKYPEKIDLNVPRRAQHLQNAWKKHQDAVYWVDIDLAICYPKVVILKIGEVLFEKAYMSPDHH